MRPVRARLLPACCAAIACLVGAAIAHAQAPLGRIAGVITDESGTPIKGVVITAQNPESAPSQLTGTTDEKGRFAILGFRRGLWTIRFTAAGFTSEETTIPLAPRQNVPLQVTLRAAAAPPARGALAGIDVARLSADLDRAEQLEEQGRDDDALAVYEKAVAAVPALTALHRQIAAIHTRRKRPDRALEAWQALLSAEPDDREARDRVGALALELGLAAAEHQDRVSAVRLLEQAIAADPSAPRAAEAKAALERLRQPPSPGDGQIAGTDGRIGLQATGEAR